MKSSVEIEAEVKYSTTAAELAALLEKVPPEAKFSVRSEPYYDQRDSGATWIKFTWTEEL